MANSKQIKMLLARSSDAGIKAEWSDFVDLNNGQIDQQLALIAAHKAGTVVSQPPAKLEETKRFNDMRFGMCCKLIVQQKNIGWCIAERDKFASEVLSLYNSCTYAEHLVKVKHEEDPSQITTVE